MGGKKKFFAVWNKRIWLSHHFFNLEILTKIFLPLKSVARMPFFDFVAKI